MQYIVYPLEENKTLLLMYLIPWGRYGVEGRYAPSHAEHKEFKKSNR